MSARRGGRVWLVDDFEFREIVKNSLSYSECLRSLGLKTRGGAAAKSLKERISILNCSTQHFYKQKWER